MAVLPLPPIGATPEEVRRFLLSLEQDLGGAVAPNDAQYFVSTTNASLTNERNLGVLASGYLKIAVGAGVAVPSTTATIPGSDIVGAITTTALTVSNLTDTRIPIVGVAGLLGDDADLTFSGSTLTATNIVGTTSITTASFTDSGLTATRVTFAGVGGVLSDDADLTFVTDTLTATKYVATTHLVSPLIYGSTAANGDLTLEGTSHATKTTSYVILQPTAGNVGIGTVTPTFLFNISATAPSDSLFSADIYSADIGQATFIGRKARGTAALPTQALTGDILSALGGRGYRSTGGFAVGASGLFGIWAAENFATGAQGTYLTFETTATGSAGRSERVRILANGNVGIRTTLPTLELDVTGQFGVKPTGSGFPTSLSYGFAGRFYAVHGSGDWGFILARAVDDAGGANLTLYHTRNSDGSIKTALVNGDYVGRFNFQGATSSSVVTQSIEVLAQVVGVVSSGVLPTDLIFSLAASGDTNDGGKEKIRFTSAGRVSIGAGASPDRLLHAEIDDAVTNVVTYAQRLTHITSGTPANGIGVGLEFEVETTASNNEVGVTIDAVVTDVTAASEDFALAFSTMAAGAAAVERVRIESAGLGIGTTTFGASMVGGFAMKTGTAPSGNVTDVFQMYSADQAAGNAAPHWRTENGDIVKLFKTGTYTPSNVSVDRSYDANATTTDELADVLGTLIADLQLTGVLG